MHGRPCGECPAELNAPRTGQGEAALRVASLPGVWRFGAMGGMTGLDWSAAAAVAAGLTPVAWAALAPLLAACEAGAVEGSAARAERERDDRSAGDGRRDER